MFSTDKLFKLMKAKGYTNKKMADALNSLGIKISADAFKQYKAGHSKPRMEVFEGIVEVLGVLEQDFFEISPKRSALIEQEKDIDISTNISNNTISIPMIYSGDDINILSKLSKCEQITLDKNIFHNIKNQSNLIGVKVTGDAMKPEINENNILIIELINGKDFIKSDGLYLVEYGGVMQIKKVQFLGKNKILLINLNKDYPPINLHNDNNKNYTIIGKAIAKLDIKQYAPLVIKTKEREKSLLVS